MPLINIQMLSGRTPAQKSAFIKAIAEATVANLGVPEEAIRVILTEVSPDHWGNGSKTMADIRREAG